VPFASGGKRSFVIDSMQFLVNKVVNRPNTEKRWVTLGVGEHPAPRSQRPNGPAAPSAPPVPAVPSAAATTPSNGVQAAPSREKGPRAPAAAPAAASRQAPSRAPQQDDAAVEVKADPKLTALAVALGEKAAKFGRPLAVLLVDTDDRVRLLNAGKAVKGQSTRVEGEGHNRRVVFFPEKPVPMPKKTQFPVFDVEEDDE
jgi:hypothetical protein